MRNLKRVLSLALALIMVLGLMVMTGSAASADFDDAAEISYTEAVDVLTGIGILEGDENGSFNPTQVLTREQAAKIICYLVLGPDAAEKANANNSVAEVFSDVEAGRWSAGYIAYCANTGYIAGYGNGMYGPEDELTGVAFAKLLLVALGYDAAVESYVNTGDWATNVAVDAIDAGIDLPGVLLSAPLTREQAAQMAFQALQADVVEYENKGMEVISTDGTVVRTNVKGPYAVKSDNKVDYDSSKDGVQQLTEKLYPDLVKFNDAVTGNEYADLNGDEPLAEGKTVIGGVTYNVTTTLADIGESRQGWAYGKDVLVIGDSGKNTVEEFTAKTELKKSVKMKTDKDTESYVNFADPSEESYAAVYRIAYEMTGITLTARQVTVLEDDGITCTAEGGNKYTVSNTIKADGTVTGNDLVYIKSIFASADEDDGYVYVGTQSTKDISNAISYRDFLKEYVEIVVKSNDVTANENGNYVKVIDNDGDGVADYILKTVYTLAAITDISEKTGYTITGVTDAIKSSAVVSEDELDEGDVIVYADIDGVYYANLAEVVTATVDSKGVDYKNETITCGETTYGQSGINPTTAAGQSLFSGAFLNDVFEFEVTQAETEVEYDFYLDNYGYVRAFALNTTTNGLGLLTDAYYGTDRKTNTYKVDMVTASAEKAEYTVYEKRSDLSYIDTTEGDSGDRSTWGRLNGFQSVLSNKEVEYGLHSFTTNVVGYSGSADSLIILDPTGYVKPAYIMGELDMTVVSALNNQKYSIINSDNSRDAVYATSDTVYFYYNTKGNVTTWTGYKNAPDSVTLYSSDIAYTVAHKSAAADKYYVADVIVIEQKGSDKSASFLYDAYQRNTGYVVTTISVTNDGVDTAAITSGLKAVTTTSSYAYPAFYEIGKSAVEVTSGYEDYNIYAARSQTSASVNVRDYVYLSGNPGVSSFITTNVEVYKVAYKNGDYSISNCKTITAGDRLIYVTDGKSVEYVINVDESYYTDRNGNDIYFLTDLYNDIIADQNTPTGDVTVTFFGQEAQFTPAASTTKVNDYAGTYTLTVSYADALVYADAYPAAKFLRVDGGSIVTGDKAVTKVDPDGSIYTGTILSETGKYYNFVLTQEAAIKDAMLYGMNVLRTSLNDDYGHYYELNFSANWRITIQEYLDTFDLSDDATVDWYFVTTGNTEIKFSGMEVPDLDKTIYNGVTISEIKYVWAHVTSDDGKVENDFMNSAYFTDVFSRFDAKAVITAVHTPQTVLTKDSSTQSAALTTETYTLSVPKNFDKDQLDPQKIGNSIINVAWTHAKNTSVTRDGNVITVKADSDWRGRGYEATITIVERSNPTFGVTAWSASASGNLCVAVWCNDYYYSEDFDALYAPGELLREDDLEDLLDGIDQDNFKLYWNNDTHTAANAPIYETADNATYGDFTDPVHQYVTSHDYGFVKLTFLNVDGTPAIGAGSSFNGQNGDTIDANTGVFRLTLNGVNVAQVYAAIAIPTT